MPFNTLKKYIENYFWPILFLFGVILYFNTITSSSLFDPDAPYLQNVLGKMSLKEFWNKGLFIYDVIFIRDIVLYLCSKLELLLGFQVYGTFNFVIFFLCLKEVSKIFSIKKDIQAFLLILVLISHPMLSWVITWPTANKHILAILFTLKFILAVKDINQSKVHSEWRALIYYFLAVNSQPIIILVPCAVFFLIDKEKWRKHIPLVALLGVIAAFYGLMNYFYYSVVYPMITLAPKFAPLEKAYLAFNFLGLSRGFSQFIFPLNFSTYYSPNSLLSLLGLPLFTLIFFFIKNRFSNKDFFFRLFLILIPFLVIYSKPTNVLVSDPYYLLPLLIFWVTLFQSFSSPKFKTLIPCLFLLYFIPKNIYESRIATSKEKRVKTSYLREPDCKNALSYSSFLLGQNQKDEFIEVTRLAIDNKCLIQGPSAKGVIQIIYSYWAYLEPRLSRDQKLTLLKPKSDDDIINTILYLKLLSKDPKVGNSSIRNVVQTIEAKTASGKKLGDFEKFVLKILKEP